MLGSNQRPLPCEGSTMVCWRCLEIAKYLQICRFPTLTLFSRFQDIYSGCCTVAAQCLLLPRRLSLPSLPALPHPSYGCSAVVTSKEKTSPRVPAAALPSSPSPPKPSYPPSAPRVRSQVARAHAWAHGSRTLVALSSCTRPWYCALSSYLSLTASLSRSALRTPPSAKRAS